MSRALASLRETPPLQSDRFWSQQRCMTYDLLLCGDTLINPDPRAHENFGAATRTTWYRANSDDHLRHQNVFRHSTQFRVRIVLSIPPIVTVDYSDVKSSRLHGLYYVLSFSSITIPFCVSQLSSAGELNIAQRRTRFCPPSVRFERSDPREVGTLTERIYTYTRAK